MNFCFLGARHAKYVGRNIEALCLNQFCRGKAISNTHSESVYIALGTQHAKRMCHFISSFVDCPAVPHLCTLSHKRHD